MNFTTSFTMLGAPAVANLMSILFDASIKGSVLLVLAWMATRLFRSASAALKHLVWSAALAGIVIIPLLSSVVPRIPVAALRPIAARSLLRAFAAAPAPAPSVATTPRATPTPRAPARDRRGPVAWAAPRARASAASAAPSAIDIGSFMPAIWLAITALVLLRVVLGALRISLWSRRAQPVEDGAWLSLAQRIAVQLHIARPVTLLRSERACVPMTWGVVYPTVLLPVDADEWTAERRTIVLWHEMAHVKRLDAFTQLLAQIVVALFWFNPLVWLAARQMRTEREHACDDFVLEAGARATDYAYDLLQIARSLGGGPAPVAALAMARRSELEGRLLAILDPHTNHGRVSRGRLVLAALSVVALALPLAAFAPAKTGIERIVVSHQTVATPGLSRRVVPLAMTIRADAYSRPSVEIDTVPKLLSLSAPTAVPRRSNDFAVAMPAPQAVTLPPIANRGSLVPDRETLVAVAKAAMKMTSDHEKAELLVAIAKYYTQDDELCTAYLDVVSSISSDFERSRTLLPLLKTGGLPANAIAKVVRVASLMSSDNDKATLFARALDDQATVMPSTRDAIIVGVGTLQSDYSRRQTIAAIAQRGDLTNKQLIDLVGVTAAMSSSYDKANALIAIVTHQSIADSEVRKAFLKAAETITAAPDYRRVVSTILK